MLDSIKSLAVRQENIMVARFQLQKMQQDHGESVRAFAARLRGQSTICDFTITCEFQRTVNYSPVMIRDSLIRGLEDEEIRLELLSKSDQNMSLDETIQIAEARESGKRSALHIDTSARLTSASATSTYKRDMKVAATQKEQHSRQRFPQRTCGHCGEPGHDPSRRSRMTNCPAYNNTCSICGRLHHFAKVCRRAAPETRHQSRINQPSRDSHIQCTQDTYDTLCSVKQNDTVTANLEHHIFDEDKRTWQQRPSAPQPTVEVSITAHPEDTIALGITTSLRRPTPSILFRGTADTGCQSCLAGTNLLRMLGLGVSQLTPVSMQMIAANSITIPIIGALALRISGTSPNNKLFETRQLVYFTEATDKLFLSKQSCIALGVIPPSFPTIGGVGCATSSTMASDDHKHTCGCLRRSTPPPRPVRPPLAPTERNRKRLEEWLLKYYASSTFNTCEHQRLPTMSGPPMRLMVDPAATPTAHHTPIPIPVYWKKSVKDGLDRDVRLGVIEPVPVGTPVTWCHRMVVCPKKSGEPRRTVDLQALNRHAVRETHHTQSPFHQARAVPPNTFKTTFDAWNGYHSIPLDERDRHLTTFITPWGRYRYCVAPQGYIAYAAVRRNCVRYSGLHQVRR